MIERIDYYLELLITLCGFNGNDDSVVVGWSIVLLSTGIVIYAFYQAIVNCLWPGETEQGHVKYQVLDEDWVEEVERGEIERAY